MEANAFRFRITGSAGVAVLVLLLATASGCVTQPTGPQWQTTNPRTGGSPVLPPTVRGQGGGTGYPAPPGGGAYGYGAPAGTQPGPAGGAPPAYGGSGTVGSGVRNGQTLPPTTNTFQPGAPAFPGPPPPNVEGLPGGPLTGNFEPLAAPPRTAPIDISVQEARTGRFMFGVGVNSDLGVTGQIIVDERNFDIFRVPTSWEQIVNGQAFRGAGQGFRLEAVPGNQVQRYLASFTEPYLFSTPVSFNVSGFFYDRAFTDWNEQRLGGRSALGYRLTPDLSTSVSFRGEQVKVFQPRVLGVPALDEVIGDNDLYSGRFSLTHDTRDVPFAPTEGHLIDLSYEQAFGDFDFPRFEVDYRKYFLLRERADGSGRHTLGFSLGAGITGSNTPIYERYFAGGFSTLRGFDFRGASPRVNTVVVGGDLRILGALEYIFPLTADDMIKGVVFCDYGTVEEDIEINGENFRVSPGFGLRIAIPAMGPAPLAFDFAVPVLHAPGDDLQNFSFFVGFGR